MTATSSNVISLRYNFHPTTQIALFGIKPTLQIDSIENLSLQLQALLKEYPTREHDFSKEEIKTTYKTK